MRPCPNCGSNDHKEVMREGEFIIVNCSKCSLIFLLNPPDEESIYEDYYEIKFKKEDYKIDSKFEFLSDIYAINLQRINEIKKFKTGGTLLDIGSGSGLFLNTASEFGFECYGIDVSRKAVEFAKNEFGLQVENKRIESLISEGKTYDAICLWHVLEHFLNPVDELVRIKKLLNIGGICFIEVPNFNSIKFRLAKEKWKGGNHPLYHRTFFTNKTLNDTLRRAGLEKNKRLKLSYSVGGKNFFYKKTKDFFNLFSMDAFLDFVAYK